MRDNLSIIGYGIIIAVILSLVSYLGYAYFKYPCEAYNSGLLGFQSAGEMPSRCVGKVK